MSKLIRRTVRKGGGAALLIALQIMTLTLVGLLMPWATGPRPNKAPADTEVSAPLVPATQGDQDQTQTQTETAQPVTTAKDLTPAEKAALRRSAHAAKKQYE